MATLDELLALLPDNDSGVIDAKDLREIVTALWENDAALLGAINSVDPTPGMVTVKDTWQINPQAGATPGGQQITSDTGSLHTATEVYFAVRAQSGIDYTNALMNAKRLYGQKSDDGSKWENLEVSGTPTLNGSVVTVPVTHLGSSDQTGTAAWQSALVVIYAGGGEG